MNTLKELASLYARKQPKMADQLTEKAPILQKLKWTQASHNLWNVAENLSDIQGPAFVELNAPLPLMSATTDLIQTPVSVLGGVQEVPQDKADQFGGPAAYFDKHQQQFLSHAGMETEKRLYYDFFLKGALAAKNVIDAGGIASTNGASGLSNILVIRQDEACNTGIYDKSQFKEGLLLNMLPLHGGALYYLNSMPQVLGYGLAFKGRFGWQIIGPEKCLCAITNISKSKKANLDMLDDAIAKIHGTASDTLIIGHPQVVASLFPSAKREVVMVQNQDTNLNTTLTHYNGIEIVSSYNVKAGNETQIII